MRHGVLPWSNCDPRGIRSRPVVSNLRHSDTVRQDPFRGLCQVVVQSTQPEPNSHIAISRTRSVVDGARGYFPHRVFHLGKTLSDVKRAHIVGELFSTVLPRSREASMSGSGSSEPHICDCDRCSERIGISGKCIRNGILLSGALWLVLIGITWGVLKIFN